MQRDIRFYDTSSLLVAGEAVFDGDIFFVSSITLSELEAIKTSANKSEEVKMQARQLLRRFATDRDCYEVVAHSKSNEEYIEQLNFDINNDTRILSDAIYCDNKVCVDSVIFVTNDLGLRALANMHFGDKMIESVEEEQDDYTGYREISADDPRVADLYSFSDFNHFNLLTGEYLIIKGDLDQVKDVRVWTGEEYRYLKYPQFTSDWFGHVEPKDIYQKMLFDSLSHNKITMVRGPAGTGKTYISLAYLMTQLDKMALDRIVVFCNTVATANSAKLGFYPGSRQEKLMDSQIGNLLISKYGGKDGVDQLLDEEKLVILPLSDIRGYDTTGMKAGIYISEAQNLDRTLIKLALQRIGEDCICIVDGDNEQQTDLKIYEGRNNGMRAMSKAFRGHNVYGEIKLQNIYRSRIAAIADQI